MRTPAADICYSKAMKESFADMLVEGKRNSLGRVNEVVAIVLHDQSRLIDLYECIFHDDEWARMRAIDAFEKICREHPEWIVPFIDRIQSELSQKTQPSIQWHIAQIYCQVNLTHTQKKLAIQWLKNLTSTTAVDWIVAANAMQALVYFAHKKGIQKSEVLSILAIQSQHKSKAVVKKAKKLQAELSEFV